MCFGQGGDNVDSNTFFSPGKSKLFSGGGFDVDAICFTNKEYKNINKKAELFTRIIRKKIILIDDVNYENI